MRGGRLFRNLLLAGLVAGSGLGGCHRGKDWNVLLITLDTTRADALSCYGNLEVQTPALDSLARQGAMFEHAYSPYPMTMPAHSTILTGTQPPTHGILDNSAAYRLSPEALTLAEVLADRGWQTAAFISAVVLKKDFGINQGFQHWDEENLQPREDLEDQSFAPIPERLADLTTDAALEWLGHSERKKWFMWIHYYDPHFPYRPPAPYDQSVPDYPYLGEVAFMDSQIQRVLDRLKELGIEEKTVIVAVGDHGEGLGRHGESTHSVFIYNATQRVPFLFRLPGHDLGCQLLPTAVGLEDVMPTILDSLGIPIPKTVQGESLKPLILGQEADTRERYAFMMSNFTYLQYGWSPLAGIAGDRYKFIRAPRPELYDLLEDANEERNLLAELPKVAAEMDDRLTRMEAAMPAPFQPVRGGGEDRLKLEKELEALGYASAPQVRIDPEKARRKDPKDYVSLFPVFNELVKVMGKYDFPKALTLCEQILEKDPENLRAWSTKARALFLSGREPEAFAWLKQSLEVIGESGESYRKLGEISLGLGRMEEAAGYLRRAIELDPYDAESHYYLGMILLQAKGQEQVARELFQAQSIKESSWSHLGLARFYEKQKQVDQARAEYERALAINPDEQIATIEYILFLASQGQWQQVRRKIEEASGKWEHFLEDPHIVPLARRTGAGARVQP